MPGCVRPPSDWPLKIGFLDRFHACVDVELFVDFADIHADRADRNAELICDLFGTALPSEVRSTRF